MEEKHIGKFGIRGLKVLSVEDFLVELKREFGGGYNKLAEVAELKKLEQESRMMEKFI